MRELLSESKEDVYLTLRLMDELKPAYASFCVYMSILGTNLFETGIQKGLVQSEKTFKEFYTSSPKYYYVRNINRRVDTMDGEEFQKLELEIKDAFPNYNEDIY